MMFTRKKPRASRILLLDGPLRPNDLLDRAGAMAVADPDDLCLTRDGALLLSSGARLLRLRDWGGEFDELAVFDHPIGALATRDDGLIAVGLRGGGLHLLASDATPLPVWAAPRGSATNNIRALRFLRDGALLVANACADPGTDAADDIRDLFAPAGTGQVLRLTETGTGEVLASGLRYPHGLTETASGDVLIAESWAARVRDPAGKAVLTDAPGYPARITPTPDGGHILSLFARRDPLIEFVLSEPKFLARMTAEIDPAYLIAPRLGVDHDHRLPTQMGATRLFGETKPWAPSFSYGLVIRLDADFTPLASAHSRADGARHGITAALDWRGDLIAISKGAGALLKVTEMDKWT